MVELARNNKAVLVKIGREYWYYTSSLRHGCYNSQSLEYNAVQALESFEREFGKALTTRKAIKAC